MKKSIPAAVMAAAALTLTACGAAPEEAGGAGGSDQSDFLACLISDEGGWDDASFNESAFNGLTQAESDLGVKVQDAESTDPGQYAANADAMVQAGCNLTVGVGFALEDTIQEAAEANPDTNFALVDSGFSDADFAPVELENAKPLLFNTQEAAYLAGYLAAGMSKTGTVATYGGQPFPSVTIFMDGFVDGVAAYNEAKGANVKTLGWDKEKQNGSMTGDFTNTENGYNTTKQFINNGADVIMPVAGPVGSGSLRAAEEADGVSVIWVDSDGYEQPANEQFKSLILTSVQKQIQTAVYETIEAASAGNFSSEAYVGTLENGGVGLASFHDFESKVPDELKAEIEQLKAQIVAGDLVVESPSSN